MERANKDVLIELALNLDPPSLTRLCQTSKRMNEIICDNEIFWRKKIEKERPGILDLIKIGINNPLNYKQIYEDLYLNNYVFSVKYVSNPLQIYGAIQGILEEYDFIIAEDTDLQIGDKAWVVVTTRPDISFENPLIFKTKKQAVENIVKEIEFQLEDGLFNKEKYVKELNETGRTTLDYIEFMMKEVTIL
jgi:hypothetical protein